MLLRLVDLRNDPDRRCEVQYAGLQDVSESNTREERVVDSIQTSTVEAEAFCQQELRECLMVVGGLRELFAWIGSLKSRSGVICVLMTDIKASAQH